MNFKSFMNGVKKTPKEALNYLHTEACSSRNNKSFSALEGAKAIIEYTLDKIESYDNIEKKLGIDFITLFEALENGIHKKDDLDCCYECKLRFMKGEWYLAQPFDENYAHIVNTKDYGKTWALTKEELL